MLTEKLHLKSWKGVIYLPILVVAALLLSTCQLPATPKGQCALASYIDSTDQKFVLPYNLSEPEIILTLPGKLKEISGLSVSSLSDQLLAVQDEKGIIFWIDTKTGAITKEHHFWKDGDYEGIEWAEGFIYVVKSSGTIYKVHPDSLNREAVEKFNTFLKPENDVEGLSYDPVSRKLLLACKAKAGEGDNFIMSRSIYAFDLDKNIVEPDPKYCIKLEQINDYLATDPIIRKLEKLNELFAPTEPEFGFSPSAIARHPFSHDYYLLSSVSKILLILAPDGKIKHIEKLKKSIHPQPEGICFSSSGELFISNEGKGGYGKICKFNFSSQ